jgi:4-alpha-glucanotransferase
MKMPISPFTFDRRTSGLLIHPTSLPGPHGNGDLGRGSEEFVDFLAAAGQKWWQMLPVGPPGEGNSPYSAASAFAGHPALISLGQLVEQGLLESRELGKPRFSDRRIEHDRVLKYRDELLRKAFERFTKTKIARSTAFRHFETENAFWLDDFCLFAALKHANGGRKWSEWEAGIRTRKAAALARAKDDLADEIEFQKFVQFKFSQQWQALRAKCAKNGIGLIGDIPIFVAYDSAEVWANPHLFLLDREGCPKVVSGCPPDFFNADGQRWNHPHYDWKVHAKEKYQWWIERFRQTLRMFDAVRIDHFLGFHRVWSIPASSPSAKGGRYTPGPGATFFQILQKNLGEIPIIAEDLGTVTPEALALRDQFNFPGMRVLQFGFGDGGGYHLPHNYPRRCVTYTGTHDNDTSAGWLRSISARERQRVAAYVGASGAKSSDGEAVWSLIRTASNSVADTAIFPVQDLLGLGNESRMNLPGTVKNNWSWRLESGKLTPAIARRLRELTEVCGRG